LSISGHPTQVNVCSACLTEHANEKMMHRPILQHLMPCGLAGSPALHSLIPGRANQGERIFIMLQGPFDGHMVRAPCTASHICPLFQGETLFSEACFREALADVHAVGAISEAFWGMSSWAFIYYSRHDVVERDDRGINGTQKSDAVGRA
jgi:hypothetical protein